MKHVARFLGVALLVGCGLVPGFVIAAEESTATQEDLLSITERAEATLSGNIPQGVKDFFNRNFAAVERFRLKQFAIATAKRDELAATIQLSNESSASATDENRDDVLEGESTSLYDNMGERLPSDAPTQTMIKYYAYKYYAMFVGSPIVFYLVGSFIIVYLIGMLFNRARRRGGE